MHSFSSRARTRFLAVLAGVALVASGGGIAHAEPPPNASPTASFYSAGYADFQGFFNASWSTDSDGTIASYAWTFGDGATGSGLNPVHAYPGPGTYTVELTVTDDDGATGVMTSTILLETMPPSIPPVASFTFAADQLEVTFDGFSSSDADGGSINFWYWDFGDGSPVGGGDVGGARPTHTYATPGTYDVTLTVVDSDQWIARTTSPVTVTITPNDLPTASFTATTSGLVAGFDGSPSSDPDGTLESYVWDFGDSTSDSGVTTGHRYDAAGTYQVSLTVTDDLGGKATTTRSVTVVVPPAPKASDAFGRTVSNGFGSAEIGGAWTVLGGTSGFAVSSGTGRMTAPPSHTLTSYLNAVSSSNLEVVVQAALQPAASGGGAYVSVIARKTAGGEYLARAKVLAGGSVQLQLIRGTTTLAAVTVPGLTLMAGEQLWFRVQATGTSPTTLRVKVWEAGTTEPAAWQITRTDSTAGLQTAGSIGLRSYVSSSSAGPIVVAFDNLKAGAPGTLGTVEPPANVPPTASFVVTGSDLFVLGDGSASHDSDGTIVFYKWDFGNGHTDDGPSPEFMSRYTMPGTYTVTLTVTDDDGATNTTTRPFTAKSPVPPVGTLIIADGFDLRTVSNGLGTANLGGSWVVGPNPSLYQVAVGTGRLTSPIGGTTSAYLPSITGVNLNTEVVVRFTGSVTGGGFYISAIGRRVDTNEYSARVKIYPDRTVQLQILRGATTLQTVTLNGIALFPGAQIKIRIQVTGTSPTTIQAKAWRLGQVEPAEWQASVTDNTAGLQGPGYVGIRTYQSGSATSAMTSEFDSVMVAIP